MIIGSSALKYHFPDFPREPKDLDFVYYNEYDKLAMTQLYKKNYSSCKIEALLNPVLLKHIFNTDDDPTYCPIDELYTLKISHVFWDLENKSWDKHMWDIQWLKEKGCVFIPDLFYKLYDYWNTIHGVNKRSNLEMSAEQFFDNVVNFPVEHDHLHELLVEHDYFIEKQPTYKKILKEGADVDVSEDKFNTLTELEKFNLVTEEVMIMALERYGNLYYKQAFSRMLKKFILGHAPVWEAIWIIQNHKNILTNIPFNYITFLNNKINEQYKNRNTTRVF